jgi:hypothetical protein
MVELHPLLETFALLCLVLTLCCRFLLPALKQGVNWAYLILSPSSELSSADIDTRLHWGAARNWSYLFSLWSVPKENCHGAGCCCSVVVFAQVPGFHPQYWKQNKTFIIQCPSWQSKHVIPALRKLKQEDFQFKSDLGYNSKPCLKKKRKELSWDWGVAQWVE